MYPGRANALGSQGFFFFSPNERMKCCRLLLVFRLPLRNTALPPQLDREHSAAAAAAAGARQMGRERPNADVGQTAAPENAFAPDWVRLWSTANGHQGKEKGHWRECRRRLGARCYRRAVVTVIVIVIVVVVVVVVTVTATATATTTATAGRGRRWETLAFIGRNGPPAPISRLERSSGSRSSCPEREPKGAHF